jgi:hypothetical protein
MTWWKPLRPGAAKPTPRARNDGFQFIGLTDIDREAAQI